MSLEDFSIASCANAGAETNEIISRNEMERKLNFMIRVDGVCV